MRFPKANDPIPGRCIAHSDAFMRYFRLVTPSSAIAQPLLMEKAHGEYLRLANGWNRLLGEAEISFRAAICAGELKPWIRDPITGDILEPTPRDDWERKGSFEPDGIHDNFVVPDDPFDPGPNTEIRGMLRPVFYQLDAFEAWMNQQRKAQVGGGIAEFKQWLRQLMVANDRQPKSKKKLMDEAKEKFGVGTPTFRKAWDKLIEETGRQKWKEPGRPPKSCTT